MKSHEDVTFKVLDSMLEQMFRICDQRGVGRGGRDRLRHLRQAKRIWADAETSEDLLNAVGILSEFLLESR